MTRILYRKANIEDVEQLSILVGQLNQFHNDATIISSEILRRDWAHIEAFVAEDTGNTQLVGFVSGYNGYQFHTGTPRYEIQNLHVSELYRRKGIAKALISFVVAQKFSEGGRKFALGVDNDNKVAREFYISLGFEEKSLDHAKRCVLEKENLARMVN